MYLKEVFILREQEMFKCTIMRGGTSKAVFLKKNELPSDPVLRDKIILGIFGSPDVRQIDGLGGSDITTSKVAIIGPPTRDDADIDYNFGQVQLKSDEIVWNANCGNISSAVGPFAIDEGMVKASEPYTTVRINNVNTNKILIAKVEVKNGKAVVDGDFVLDGVPGTGSKIELDFKNTFGAATGKLLPTGNSIDVLNVNGLGKIPVSIVDIANIICYVNAKDVDAKATEPTPDILVNTELKEKLEAIRSAVAVKCGFIKPGEDALKLSPIRPAISFVAPATDYADYGSGKMIKKEDIDFVARILWNQMPTDTFPTTATICITVAALIQGTLVNQVYSPNAKESGFVQLGINKVEVAVEKSKGEPFVKKAIFPRTARRIMDGYVYVKKSIILNS